MAGARKFACSPCLGFHHIVSRAVRIIAKTPFGWICFVLNGQYVILLEVAGFHWYSDTSDTHRINTTLKSIQGPDVHGNCSLLHLGVCSTQQQFDQSWSQYRYINCVNDIHIQIFEILWHQRHWLIQLYIANAWRNPEISWNLDVEETGFWAQIVISHSFLYQPGCCFYSIGS